MGARRAKGGFALGSLGAFLVIEAREHAEARGAKPLARLDRACRPTARKRSRATSTAALDAAVGQASRSSRSRHAAVISGATGAEPATAEERAFLEAHRRSCRARHRLLSRAWAGAAIPR